MTANDYEQSLHPFLDVYISFIVASCSISSHLNHLFLETFELILHGIEGFVHGVCIGVWVSSGCSGFLHRTEKDMKIRLLGTSKVFVHV